LFESLSRPIKQYSVNRVPVFLFCILTLNGLRAGEVLGLKWGDIDFDRSSLHIRRTAWYGKIQTAKSEASETVLPIPSSLLTMLKNYRVTWKPNEAGFLFVTRNGRPPIFQQSRGISPVDDSRRAGDPAV
jgi:integrase